MANRQQGISTLADVLSALRQTGESLARQRDLISAVNRISEMAAQSPERIRAEPANLRGILTSIRPAAHGVKPKTWSNLKSGFSAALELTGVIDRVGRGEALRHPEWGPLMKAVARDRRLADGLAAFANWCASTSVLPDQVTDETVRQFLSWLEADTLYLRARNLVRRIPIVWKEAQGRVVPWPATTLTKISFKPPAKRHQWDELSPAFRSDVDAYLAVRGNPDIFDDRAGAPKRPLASTTLRLTRENLRVAASVLITEGVPKEEIRSLSDLVRPDHFKTVLRYYHNKADGQPNGFVISLARALIQVAKFHVGVSEDRLQELKRAAGKLPPIPFDLRPKNKALLRQLESERLRAKLVFLPEELLGKVARTLDTGRLPFVDAQVALAVDIDLVAPLRPENLARLNWGRHFSEPDGPKGRLILHIPAAETKTRKRDLTFELPDDLAARLRWYRRNILPRLNADIFGDLFVTRKGGSKTQETLSQQLTETIEREVGLHVTPHQFRHIAAVFYLERHPEDFETVRALLGHEWSKTTLVYAGSSSRRAGRAYSNFVLEQREALKWKRPIKKTRSLPCAR
jgi:integrase